MPDPIQPYEETSDASEVEGEPLSGWGRAAAGIAGLALSGAGAVAVFLTSNQAGSVALVLGGIVFLLITITGNPLSSLGHGETQMRFATRRRRVIEDAQEAPPREARGALAALSTIDPRVSRDAAFIRTSMLVYERLVHAELIRLFPEFSVREQVLDRGFDFIVATPEGYSVFIEVKYLSGPVSTKVISQLTGMVVRSDMAGVLVANQPLTRAADALLQAAREDGSRVAAVRWRDERDSDALKSAVFDLLRKLGYAGGSAERYAE